MRHYIAATRNIPVYLPARETSFPFLIIGSETFFGIVTLKAELQQLSFDGQGFRECHFGPRLHRTFDAPHRPGCPVQMTELARILQHLVPVVLRLIDVVDQPGFERLFKAHQLTFGHVLNRLILGQRPCQTLGANRPRKYA